MHSIGKDDKHYTGISVCIKTSCCCFFQKLKWSQDHPCYKFQQEKRLLGLETWTGDGSSCIFLYDLPSSARWENDKKKTVYTHIYVEQPWSRTFESAGISPPHSLVIQPGNGKVHRRLSNQNTPNLLANHHVLYQLRHIHVKDYVCICIMDVCLFNKWHEIVNARWGLHAFPGSDIHRIYQDISFEGLQWTKNCHFHGNTCFCC